MVQTTTLKKCLRLGKGTNLYFFAAVLMYTASNTFIFDAPAHLL